MTEEALFREALARPAADRAAFLADACAGQPRLRAAVEALLAAHEASRDVPDATVDSPPGPSPTDVTADFSQPPDERPVRSRATGEEVIAGRYTLVEKLGEGGMGEVWVARQTEPVKRRVALKLIKSGMDSASVLARFEQERQALALMDHPNIARVLDGGVTPSGQPFFVMELVNGLPLTQFCDEMRLTPRERLELFVLICQAVQHAHQKGIVHRDLKPANILVTVVDGRPVPKVIDFGVAKATGGSLTEQEFATHSGAVVGTLEYMSPEQAGYSGVDVDTRADVYSLGVVLYELLTGLRPIDGTRLRKAGLVEMIRVIQEVEPSRPSTRLSTEEAMPTLAATRATDPRKLMAMLRGELDWVVMKCLEKDRARRYESASDLAKDVQRYLADEPVEARPPSFGYRLWKAWRRNRVAVAAVGAVAAALLLGLGLAIWQAVVATRAQDDAIRLAGEKSQLADDNARLAAKESQAKGAALAANREKDDQLRRTQAVLFSSQVERAGLVRDRNLWAALGLLYDLNFCPVEQRDLAWNAAVASTLRPRLCSVNLSGNVAALSPDGTILASVVARGVRLHAIPSGTEIARVPIQGAVGDGEQRLVFSPDGRVLAFVSDGPLATNKQALPGKVRLLDVAEKKWLPALEGHTDRVACVAFSPAGKHLASGSLDGTVRVWDRATGQAAHTLRDHGKAVAAVAFSPDGKRLASGGLDENVRLWTTDTFAPVATWKIDANPTTAAVGILANPFEAEGVFALDFSPNGKVLAVASSRRVVEFREAATGDVLHGIYDRLAFARNLQFHPDGRSVFMEADVVGQWEVGSGRLLRELYAGFGAVAFSRNTGRVVVGGWNDPAQVCDFSLPTEAARLPLDKEKGPRPAAAFTPTGDTLAAAGTAGIVLWDVASREVRDTLVGHRNTVTAVAIDPHGKRLASGDRAKGGPVPSEPASIRLWDLDSGEALAAFEVGDAEVRSLAFSPDGTSLATFHWDWPDRQALPLPVVSVWDVARLALRYRLEVPPGSWEAIGPDLVTLAYHPKGGSLLLASGRRLAIWDLATRQVERQILVGSPGDLLPAPTFADMAVSPDGTRIATCNFVPQSGPELNLWDFESGRRLHRINPGRGSLAGYSMRFSPDGRTLIVGGEDGVRFIDVATMQSRGSVPVEGSRSQAVFLSPDGRTLAAIPIAMPLFDRDAETETVPIRLWDVGPQAVKLVFPGRLSRAQIRLSRDRRTVIDASGTGLLHLWDAETGTRRVTLDVTRQAIGNQESPDGRYLVGSSQAPTGADPAKAPATVTVYDLREQAFRSFDLGVGQVQNLFFSRDGTLLIAQRVTLEVQVIDLATGTVGPAMTPKPLGGMRFSRDGTRLVVTSAGQATVWDWRTGKQVDEPIPEPPPPVAVPEGPFALVPTPLGMMLVDQRIQPPPAGRRP